MRLIPCALAACVLLAGWSPEQPGQKFHFRAADLPAPHPGAEAGTAPPLTPWPDGVTPKVPAGFAVSAFARLDTSTGWMAVAPDGDVYVSEPLTGKVVRLHDSQHTGRADQTITVAEGFKRPHGLELHEGWLYVSDPRILWRIKLADGTREQVHVISGTPADEKATARDIAFDKRGVIYWGFASLNNAAEDPAPDATIQALAPDGGSTTYAAGLATVAALAFHDGKLFATIDERDGLGPGLVPDYFTHIEAGGFYGWPYAYIGPHPDPAWDAKRADLVAKSKTPDLLLAPGSTPMGFAFYQSRQFPRALRGEAFIALHGSWKEGAPAGYTVAHAAMRHGDGAYENFVTGFVTSDGKNLLGRPTDVAVARDGSLLISDDIGRTIWRVTYTGK